MKLSQAKVFSCHASNIWTIQFDQQAKFLFSGCGSNNSIHLHSLQTNKSIQIKQHGDQVNSISISPDNKFMVTSSWNKTLIIWKRSEGLWEELNRIPSHSIAVQFGSDSFYFASVNFDMTITFWRKNQENDEFKIDETIEITQNPLCLSFNADFTQLVVGTFGGSLLILKQQKEQGDKWFISQQLQGHYEEIRSISFNKNKINGNTIASVSLDKKVRFWKEDEQGTYRPQQLFNNNQGDLWACSFHPRQDILASGGEDRVVKFWNQVNHVWQLFDELKVKSEILSLNFSNDGRYLAIGLQSGGIQVHQIQNQ